MKSKLLQMTALAATMVCLAPNQAWAGQEGGAAVASPAVLEQLQALRAQMAAMAGRIDALEAELATAKGDAAAANAAAEAANARAVAAQDAATQADVKLAAVREEAVTLAKAEAAKASPIQVKWKGGPQFSNDEGWKFKLGGRLNLDGGYLMVPDSTGRFEGFGSEVRRARIRIEGDIPGGFGYKFETEFASNATPFTDAYITYETGPVKVTVGQHNTFQGFEELSSSLHTSFIERAAFTDAFNFERRVGLSLEYERGDVLLQGGLFTDYATELPNRNWSLDTRAVYMPKLGETQLHFGGSFHYAELNEENATVRYRQRPFEHFTDERFINTGTMSASAERGIGLEAAMISGRFHAASEAYWQKVSRPGLADPTFFGGYVEMGYFLTGGDRRGYKPGVYDRVKPANGFDKGGIGAIEVNARYDYLDLSDAGIVGGTQKGYEFSLGWWQTAYTKLTFNYAHLDYTDAVYPTQDGSRDYAADVMAVRAQVDF